MVGKEVGRTVEGLFEGAAVGVVGELLGLALGALLRLGLLLGELLRLGCSLLEGVALGLLLMLGEALLLGEALGPALGLRLGPAVVGAAVAVVGCCVPEVVVGAPVGAELGELVASSHRL